MHQAPFIIHLVRCSNPLVAAVPAAPGPFIFDVIVNGGVPLPTEPIWVKEPKTE